MTYTVKCCFKKTEWFLWFVLSFWLLAPNSVNMIYFFSWLVPKNIDETIDTALAWDIPPDITHNNSYMCMTDSSFQTLPVAEMPLLVCTTHNKPYNCDWCLFPLISFICSWRLGGAVFQGQWITRPRQGKTLTSIMGLGTLTGSYEMSWTEKEGL